MQRFETEVSVFHLPGFAEPSSSGSGDGAAPAAAEQRQRSPRSPRAAGAAAAPCAARAPPAPRDDLIPWSAVQEALAMSADALSAKQRFAEVMRSEADRLKAETGAQKEVWTRRAQRAETDSGSLLEQLESLLDAKSALASDREELGRGIGLLRAERELLCEQLQVDPSSANLCREVEAALVESRRSGVLEAQLRVLLRQRRQLRLELEAARDAHARHRDAWQAREEAYCSALAAAGVPEPDLPPAPGAAAHAEPASPTRPAAADRQSCGAGSVGSCCDVGGGGDAGGGAGGPSSSVSSSGLAGPASPGLVDAARHHPLLSPAGSASARGGGGALSPRGPSSGCALRRSLSVDAGFDAALEQAGLEAALERLALPEGGAPAGAEALAGGGGGGASEEDELAALVEAAAAAAAAGIGRSNSSTNVWAAQRALMVGAGAGALRSPQHARRQQQQQQQQQTTTPTTATAAAAEPTVGTEEPQGSNNASGGSSGGGGGDLRAAAGAWQPGGGLLAALG